VQAEQLDQGAVVQGVIKNVPHLLRVVGHDIMDDATHGLGVDDEVGSPVVDPVRPVLIVEVSVPMLVQVCGIKRKLPQEPVVADRKDLVAPDAPKSFKEQSSHSSAYLDAVLDLASY
jgi:hypothetical protein